MTVNYNLLISNSTPINRLKLLFRWRGSIWKALASELALWIICFSTVAYVYNTFLDEETKRFVVNLSEAFNKKMDYIPLNFILSFFVTAVVTRWTYIFHNIGLIDNVAFATAFNIRGLSDRARVIRRNIVRYALICQVMVFRDVSIQVRKRFPTWESIVRGNFMSDDELNVLLSYDKQYTLAKYWMPIIWAQNAVHIAKNEGFIHSDIQYDSMNKILIDWRTQLSQVANYDWVPLPLMYPQLVILAVHSYFYICLISRQISFLGIDRKENAVIEENISKCTLSILQFIFYVGWLKVAEALLNPMGEDDDDFETNFVLDKNLKNGLAIVDKGYNHIPPLVPDPHWDMEQPLLYTENSRPVNPLFGSAAQFGQTLKKSMHEQPTMVPLDGDLDDSYKSRKASKSVSSLFLKGTKKSTDSTPNLMRASPFRSSGAQDRRSSIASIASSCLPADFRFGDDKVHDAEEGVAHPRKHIKTNTLENIKEEDLSRKHSNDSE